MSVTIMGRVFYTPYQDINYVEKSGKTVSVAQASAKVTMLAIADSADDFGENSYCSFETLANKTGLERRSVIRVCRALIAHGYLSISGLSIYGTNNFKIAMDKLGELPTRRAKVGRPASEKTSDSAAQTGDSVAQTGDSTSPDPSLTHPYSLKQWDEKFKNMPLDWLVASGMEVPKEVIQDAQSRKQAVDSFEKSFGFGKLPWDSNTVWEKFHRWVCEIYKKNPTLFSDYAAWREDGGKYKAMSNKQIRMNPQLFIDTGYPEYEALRVLNAPKPQCKTEKRQIPAGWEKFYESA